MWRRKKNPIAEKDASWMRGAFLAAKDENKKILGEKAEGQYSPKMIEALRKMASHDVFPDKRFTSMDIIVWSMFR